MAHGSHLDGSLPVSMPGLWLNTPTELDRKEAELPPLQTESQNFTSLILILLNAEESCYQQLVSECLLRARHGSVQRCLKKKKKKNQTHYPPP